MCYTMSERNFSCVKRLIKTVHIALPSMFVSNVVAGVIEIFESWKRQYVQQLKGIVVGYRNVSLVSNSGFIIIDKPFIHYDVKAEFDVFYPAIGSIVKGTINRISPNHIGCLVHSTINVSIHLSHESSENISEFIQLDREILFEVTHFDFHRKIVRVKAKITNDCVLLMKDMWPNCQHLQNTIKKYDFPDVPLIPSNEEVVDLNSKIVKKKKKRDKDLDSSRSDESVFSKINLDCLGGPAIEPNSQNFDDNSLLPAKCAKKKRHKSNSKENTVDVSSAFSKTNLDFLVGPAIEPNVQNFDDDSLLHAKSPKKKKHKSNSEENIVDVPSAFSKTNLDCLGGPAIKPNSQNFDDDSLLAAKSPKKKKHKSKSKENTVDVPKSFHNTNLDHIDYAKYFLKIKEENEDSLDKDIESLSSPVNHSKKRKLSISESTLSFSNNERSPKKKKLIKKEGKKSKLLKPKKKDKGKSDKKIKHKKKKPKLENKDQEKNKKSKRAKENKPKHKKASKGKHKTGSKTKLKKNKSKDKKGKVNFKKTKS